MNELFQTIKNISESKEIKIAWVIIFVLWIIGILYGQDIKTWRIKSFQEQKQKENEPPLIVCSFCKGTGESPTDVNKLMMDAGLALFINKHLMVDKCDKCVKLPYGDVYDYCDTVQNKYRILLQEYGAAGPKIDMAACDKCMGMGTFSSKDLSTGKWITQEEYDEKHKKN